MAHDPSMGFADYFRAAAAAAAVVTLMPEMDDGAPEMYGVQAGMELLGMRGLAATSAGGGDSHGLGKAALMDEEGADGSAMRFFLEQQHHHNPSQTPLSLSLCRPEHALRYQQEQRHLGGSSSRQHLQAPASWMLQAHDTAAHGHGQGQGAAWQVRSSRFVLPAQDLLQRYCSLPVAADGAKRRAQAPPSTRRQEDVGGGDGSSAQIQAMDAPELQRLKDRLYVMLDEVDRRYRRYCEQMREVAGGFEAAAGDRAAAAYTALAARTISRHFRNLRDAVVGQLLAVRKALGEKDAAAAPPPPGMTRGQTPRLKVLDQCIRQHRALHQIGTSSESHPWRPQRGLPDRAVTILRSWLFEHFLHPYPSDVDKHVLARQTGLSRSQVSNWFINARVRLWKPMVEEMYVEEMKLDGEQLDQDGEAGAGVNPNPSSSGGGGGGGHDCDAAQLQVVSGDDHRDWGGRGDDRKPTPGQLRGVIHDAGSLASVVHTTAAGARMGSFGIMDHLGFDAYDGDVGGGVHEGFVRAGGVSLTLGLQQHDSHGGVNIAFGGPPPSAHGGGGGGGGEGGLAFVDPGEAQSQFGSTVMVVDGAESSAHGQEHYRELSAGFHLLRDLAG